MSLLLGIFILLACLIVGVRYGSLGLPVISGIGLIIYVFVLGYKPGTPPIAVMLTIIAVVTCAGLAMPSSVRALSCRMSRLLCCSAMMSSTTAGEDRR